MVTARVGAAGERTMRGGWLGDRSQLCGLWPYPSLYTCAFTSCAAASVSNYVNPGTFWIHLLVSQFYIECVPFGVCCNSMRYTTDRRNLAEKTNTHDDVEAKCCCEMYYCSPCYIAEELRHIAVLESMEKGGIEGGPGGASKN